MKDSFATALKFQIWSKCVRLKPIISVFRSVTFARLPKTVMPPFGVIWSFRNVTCIWRSSGRVQSLTTNLLDKGKIKQTHLRWIPFVYFLFLSSIVAVLGSWFFGGSQSNQNQWQSWWHKWWSKRNGCGSRNWDNEPVLNSQVSCSYSNVSRFQMAKYRKQPWKGMIFVFEGALLRMRKRFEMTVVVTRTFSRDNGHFLEEAGVSPAEVVGQAAGGSDRAHCAFQSTFLL